MEDGLMLFNLNHLDNSKEKLQKKWKFVEFQKLTEFLKDLKSTHQGIEQRKKENQNKISKEQVSKEQISKEQIREESERIIPKANLQKLEAIQELINKELLRSKKFIQNLKDFDDHISTFDNTRFINVATNSMKYLIELTLNESSNGKDNENEESRVVPVTVFYLYENNTFSRLSFRDDSQYRKIFNLGSSDVLFCSIFAGIKTFRFEESERTVLGINECKNLNTLCFKIFGVLHCRDAREGLLRFGIFKDSVPKKYENLDRIHEVLLKKTFIDSFERVSKLFKSEIQKIIFRNSKPRKNKKEELQFLKYMEKRKFKENKNFDILKCFQTRKRSPTGERSKLLKEIWKRDYILLSEIYSDLAFKENCDGKSMCIYGTPHFPLFWITSKKFKQPSSIFLEAKVDVNSKRLDSIESSMNGMNKKMNGMNKKISEIHETMISILKKLNINENITVDASGNSYAVQTFGDNCDC